MGHYVLSVAPFDKRGWAVLGDGSTQSVSRHARGAKLQRPNASNGGLRFPFAGDCLYRFGPPPTLTACKAATFGGAPDPSGSGPKTDVMRPHNNLGHASAHKLKRVLVDVDGDTVGLLGCVDEVSQQCDACRALEKTPHVPAARTSSVPPLSG